MFLIQVVADFFGLSGKAKFYREIKWHGLPPGEVPVDKPFCGFYNENPACKSEGRNSCLGVHELSPVHTFFWRMQCEFDVTNLFSLLQHSSTPAKFSLRIRDVNISIALSQEA